MQKERVFISIGAMLLVQKAINARKLSASLLKLCAVKESDILSSLHMSSCRFLECAHYLKCLSIIDFASPKNSFSRLLYKMLISFSARRYFLSIEGKNLSLIAQALSNYLIPLCMA